MRAHRATTTSFGRPSQKETPHERAEKFAAVQARLKQEAAARRAAGARSPHPSEARRLARGRERSL